jgi:cyclophilin family peptidyl-prolyl cis-trans isomerase
MIISTKKGTPKEELEKIVDRFEKQGLDVTLITGKDYTVFGRIDASDSASFKTLDAIATTATNASDKPLEDVVIKSILIEEK